MASEAFFGSVKAAPTDSKRSIDPSDLEKSLTWRDVDPGFGAVWTTSSWEKHATVFACTRNIHDDVSTTPIDVIETDSDDMKKKVATPAMFRNPNPEQTWQEFVGELVVTLVNWGTPIVVMVPLDDEFTDYEFWIRRPQSEIEIRKNNADGRWMYWDVEKSMYIPREFILRANYINTGAAYSPTAIGSIKEHYTAVHHGMRQQSKFLANATRPSVVVTAPVTMKKKELDEAKELFIETYAGSSNAGKAVFAKGLGVEAFSIKPEDAQFVETMELAERQIAAAYRMPLHKINRTDQSTQNNVEAQNTSYAQETLRPIWVKIENMFSPLLPDNQRLKFNEKAYLRGAMKDQMEAVSKGLDSGIYKLNEGREFFDLPPVEGGDEAYRPLNTRGITEKFTGPQAVEAVKALVESGFTPESAAAFLGLEGLQAVRNTETV